ncbi:16S rRNA (cytosine(1402)-N(4))-methyltransferase [Candidatus Marinamargulisbacteria bacterium SCGC AG-343-D04]|nr:16S rRNA (cytosine(1402)-N(4))-methyltransferase [Candidatus Marinamargulisbacteria bacterium SCGC AG-343-D04]
MNNTIHIPVLLKEVIDHLSIQPHDIIFEGTCGFGGHTQALINKLSEKGLYIGCDQDITAINHCKNTFASSKNCHFYHQNFSNLDDLLTQNEYPTPTKYLFDLGVSSHQFDEAERGFSHRYSSTLDMRMNISDKTTAASILNTYKTSDLSDIFYHFGELRHNKKLVENISHQRKKSPINTTDDLLTLIKKSYYFHNKRPLFVKTCSQVFQALRIECNNEFGHLKTLLNKLEQSVTPSTIIAIITFHSLEDKIVKTFVKQSDFLELSPRSVIKPSKEEVSSNSRSRSAKLRIIKQKKEKYPKKQKLTKN